MKSAAVICGIIMLMSFDVLTAAPLDNAASSAMMAGDSAKFNLDFIDPFGLPIYDITLHARAGGSNDEYVVPMTHVAPDPFYLNTYESTINFENPSGQIQFYGRVAGDTLVMTQSYQNSSNQFPPSSILYADLANDAVGDTTPGSAGQWLDLTGAAVTYSSTKIYARMSNVGGGWPTSQGFATYFLYGFFLYNPDTLTMSATAMIYGNIPFVFSPGLYSVNLADTSFNRIADISSTVSGGSLHMACNISDLRSDPHWPEWPPTSGFIMSGGFTITVGISAPSFNDYTYPSAFIPQTGFLSADNNTSPALSNIGFDIIPGIEITARCRYSDSDGNLPVSRQLFFDRGVFDMGSLDHSYGDTAQFVYLLSWPGDGLHYYFFRFSDGADTVETPMDTIYLTSNGVNDVPVPVTASLGQNYPNPFNAQTTISFNLDNPAFAELTVYDLMGQEVALLAGTYLQAGQHNIIWDGEDLYGYPMASGIYFYSLAINGKTSETRRMLLLK